MANRFSLPPAPSHLRGPVKVWSHPVSIPTYEPEPPDRNPMFLERRVYQGSSGRTYPLPFYNRISERRVERQWEAVHLENQYVRLMVLPQLGGRIHVGMDKTNGYDFFYRQNVIKPALVGLAGPWISGGVEFNWPQHHRPSTFMPTDVQIEEHADGSVTAWFSEHEPMNRTKGMHGVCLHPGRSLIELKARLYNRSEFVQTFLWWANVGTHVHERYQSFFPPDVHFVADHARRAMSKFPLCNGGYYGVDYGSRPACGIPRRQRPTCFIPPGDYPPNDLSWYANIPVPTSYMAVGSIRDFLGGYDHAKRAGLIHVADHHIAPGKKQWTWGNHPFGYAWDRNLTDADGPYIELMAGVFTDNQPDFSFIHPGETRTFSQFWYPIQQIGPAQEANTDAAVSLGIQQSQRQARIAVAVTRAFTDVVIRLTRDGTTISEIRADLAPNAPLMREVPLPNRVREQDLQLTVVDRDGQVIIEYRPIAAKPAAVPAPAREPQLPSDLATNDELYLTGLHLDQYRHATRRPELYWREALRRDPADSRCNNAMGLWHLKGGEFDAAIEHFRRAIASLTRRNANPYDGEAFYNLGLALRHADRHEEAYDAFYKATWNYAWQSAAFFCLAELDCRRGRWSKAFEHLDAVLRANSGHLQARDLKAIVLRKLRRAGEADVLVQETLRLDPLDWMARHLAGQELRCDTQVRLDLTLDLARAGLYPEAISLLLAATPEPGSGTAPLVQHYLAYLYDKVGDTASATQARSAAAAALPDYCFPSRLEEIAILQASVQQNPTDPRAPYYLANLRYDRRRHEEAIRLWERSARLDPSFSVVWRNLGIAYFNVWRDPEKARAAYEKALRVNPGDVRLLYERDQLWKRLGEPAAKRLAELSRHPELVRQRDDLSLELCALYTQTGQPEGAMEVLQSRNFQPWEGGEGMAVAQHIRAHLALGRRALRAGDAAAAIRLLECALSPPENLGEAIHPLANCSETHYWLGIAQEAAGNYAPADEHWRIASEFRGDFQEMSIRALSEYSYFAAMALHASGRRAEARKLLRQILAYARKLARAPAKIDYFATSLPTMLLFEEDLQQRQATRGTFLAAQAKLGLGQVTEARKLLKKVLRQDPNHALAAELLEESAAKRPPARRRGNMNRIKSDPLRRTSPCDLSGSSHSSSPLSSHPATANLHRPASRPPARSKSASSSSNPKSRGSRTNGSSPSAPATNTALK